MNTNDEVKFVYLQSGQTPATPDAGTVYFNPTTKDISVGDVSFKSQPEVLIYHGTISSDQTQITFDKTRTEIINEIKEYFGRYYNTHKEVIIIGYWRGTYNSRDFIFRLNDVNDLSTFLFDTYIRSSDGAFGATTEYKQIELTPSTSSNTESIIAKRVYDNPLPYVTSSDNGKVLGVSSGDWNTMDIPNQLPAVTSADDGKVLGVTSGAWGAVASVNKAIATVFEIDNNLTLLNNKKVSDIVDAIDNNEIVYIKLGNALFYPSHSEGGQSYNAIYFCCSSVVNDNIQASYLYCYRNRLTSTVLSSSGSYQFPKRPTATNKILISNTLSSWVEGDFPKELPTVTAADNGKVLMVVNGQWAVGQVTSSPIPISSSNSINVITVEGSLL